MYCKYCGAQNANDACFCKSCGAKIGEAQSVEEVDIQTQKETSIIENQTANTRKKAGRLLIILGLIIGIVGYICSGMLSDAAKPIRVQSGYSLNGRMVITDSGTIGGNNDAVSFYNALKYFFVLGGVLISFAGIIMLRKGKEFESAPTVQKRGRVIDLDILMATLEYDDGIRERVQYNPSTLLLVIGDTGVFEIKENQIVSFRRYRPIIED